MLVGSGYEYINRQYGYDHILFLDKRSDLRLHGQCLSCLIISISCRLYVRSANEAKEAQKHRRETADVHSDNTENNRSSGGIFPFCEQQTKTEFTLCNTESALYFYSVSVILICNFLLSSLINIFLWSAKTLAWKPYAWPLTKGLVFSVAVDRIGKYSFRIMPCAFPVIFNGWL